MLALACVAVFGCQGETTAPVPQQEALVGFPSAVDTALLRHSHATIVGSLASPPTARVRATEAALGQLAGNPGVSYVLTLWIVIPGDTTSIVISFRDRPTTADSLTNADRALVASVGGRIMFVYDIIPQIAARVPVWGVPVLETSPAVAAIEADQPLVALDAPMRRATR